MIHLSKQRDELNEAAGPELWCLHGAVGSASDWRSLAKNLASRKISTRAVDLWRFLETEGLSMADFGEALSAESAGEIPAGRPRILVGYSLGARLALHALLAADSPWAAAVFISSNPGLRDADAQAERRAADARWAGLALTAAWPEFLAEWNAQPVLSGGSIRDPNEDARLVQRRREIARSFVDWSLGNQEPLWEKLPSVRIPTLWIAGENDPKFVELACEASALTPGSSLAIAPESGHRVPWQNEAWLVETLSRFLHEGGEPSTTRNQ